MRNGQRLAECERRSLTKGILMLLWSLIALSAFSVFLAIIALWLVRARTKRFGVTHEQLRRLQSELAAICTCQAEAAGRDQSREQLLRTTEGRLEAVEQRLRQLVRRQDEQVAGGETSYSAAIRLAHQGADAEQLITTFGLVRGEAELIAALHRGQRERT